MIHQKPRDLYIDELLCELKTSAEDEISLRHPMAFGEVIGRERVKALAAAAETIFSKIEPSNTWSGNDIGGREWHGYLLPGSQHTGGNCGSTVRQACTDRYLPRLIPRIVRQALHVACRDHIIEDAWELPIGIDTSLPPIMPNEVLDLKLPFGLATNVYLTNPVACKPIRGVADVARLCGHSMAVYGGRASGPR